MCVLLGSAQKAPSATTRFFLHETKMQSSKLSFSKRSNATARRCDSQREPLGGLYVCVVGGQAGKGTTPFLQAVGYSMLPAKSTQTALSRVNFLSKN